MNKDLLLNRTMRKLCEKFVIGRMLNSAIFIESFSPSHLIVYF